MDKKKAESATVLYSTPKQKGLGALLILANITIAKILGYASNSIAHLDPDISPPFSW